MLGSLKFLRVIKELTALKDRQNYLARDKWYKSWSRWRNALAETREYRLFRAKVIVRAEGLCEQCSEDGEHVHHIIPVYKDLDLCVSSDNGRLLCINCHNEEHGGKLLKSKKAG